MVDIYTVNLMEILLGALVSIIFALWGKHLIDKFKDEDSAAIAYVIGTYVLCFIIAPVLGSGGFFTWIFNAFKIYVWTQVFYSIINGFGLIGKMEKIFCNIGKKVKKKIE